MYTLHCQFYPSIILTVITHYRLYIEVVDVHTLCSICVISNLNSPVSNPHYICTATGSSGTKHQLLLCIDGPHPPTIYGTTIVPISHLCVQGIRSTVRLYNKKRERETVCVCVCGGGGGGGGGVGCCT